MRAAETLYNKLWGKDLNVILEEISDNGTTWKYVPETHIGSLGMMVLGYPERCGLLVRPEYGAAFGMLKEDHKTAKEEDCGGVVVTGQLGIGKLSSLIIERSPPKCKSREILFSLLPDVSPVERNETRGS